MRFHGSRSRSLSSAPLRSRLGFIATFTTVLVIVLTALAGQRASSQIVEPAVDELIAAPAVRRTLTVNLRAPTAPTYTAPGSLKVGVAIAEMSPSGGSGIDEYSATGLPSGLSISSSTGAISGTPDTANANTASATVTVSDTADNTDTVDIAFPAVAKGDQALTGFQYSASSVTFGAAAPTVTAPTGAQTTLSYSATPPEACTVNAFSGALTTVGVGECVITATAAGTDDYNEATATYTVTVQSASIPTQVEWMAPAKFGISHHYLAGGTVGNAWYVITDYDDWNGFIDGFDVDAYAEMVKKLGVGYVFFTVTQNRGYLATTSSVYDARAPPCPSSTISPGCQNQSGVNRADYTPTRDLVHDLAVALKSKNIRLIAYLPTHIPEHWTGAHVTPRSYPDWWANEFIKGKANDWGSLVSGWWFDGWYSSDVDSNFQFIRKVERAVKEGNPNAIMAFNPGVASAYTTLDPISHYNAGEQNAILIIPGSGKLTGYGARIVQWHGWTFLQQGSHGWGNIKGNLRFESSVVANRARAISAAGGVSTWDVSINPDGIWPVDRIVQVQLIGNYVGNTTDTTYSALKFVNNSSSEITYSTGQWTHQQNRASGAYEQDVSVATETGAFFEYTFDGSSIVFATTKASDQGNVEVFIDGTSQGTFSTHHSNYRLVQEIIFEKHDLAPGSHTLKVVKRSGQYLLVDVLLSRADTPELSKLNDAQFPDGAFNGAWSHSQNRGQGDHNNDVHFTRTNDDFFSHSFYGDFVKVIMPTASDQGNVEVFLDDVSQGVFDTHSADRQVQQGVFQKSGLGLGPHAIKIVKRSGDYMLFDALEFKHGDSISQLNDSNPLLIYSGSWNNGTRTNGYYKDDIHFTRTNGDSVSYSFVGTDVQFIGPKASDQGEIEFYIDGVSQGRVNTYSAQGSVQQVIFSRTGLDPGTHSIKAVKRSGTFMVFDSMVTSTTTVAKGDQTLTGFQYSASSVTFGTAAPTVTAPTGAQTTLSYSAAPPAVCTVDSTSGALALVGAGSCVITATAASTANYNEATATYTVTVTVDTAGTLVLNVSAIATDNTINIAEKAAGFSIGGDTGSVGSVDVTVTVGSTELTATSSTADPAIWSVSVPGDAAYIIGPGVAVAVNASKTGYTAATAVRRTLTVDLTAPEAPAYTAPGSLKVGVAIAEMSPSGGSGIDEYGATGLPSGLSISSSTGAISGTPDTANANTASATVTVSDTADNTDTVDIAFPAVAKGDQALTGFQYSASSVTFGAAAPTVTAPTGAQTTLSYSATPPEACTVNAFSGALTTVGVGECVITATAAGTDDYNEATATYTVTVQSASIPTQVEWMAPAKFGISHHYLAGGTVGNAWYVITDYDDWNGFIDGFDVDAYAEMVKKLGVGYVFFTVTQNRGYLATTSSVYDAHAPPCPSSTISPGCQNQSGVNRADYTPTRDLVHDLAVALKSKNIRLIAYLPTHIPEHWTGAHVTPRSYPDWWANEFIKGKANDWGSLVSGWWFDGWYSSDVDSNFQFIRKVERAVKEGNPNAIMAFNPGVASAYTTLDPISHYNAGEQNAILIIPGSGKLTGYGARIVQWHGWTFLQQGSHGWGNIKGNLRFESSVVANRARAISAAGGVSTWDVSINPDGIWPVDRIVQVQLIGNYVGNTTDTTYSALKFVNNSSSEITYSTGQWTHQQNRASGAYEQDVSVATETGAFFEYTFDGSSIVFATTKASDQGNVEVFIDGTSQGTFSTHHSNYRLVQEIIFEKHDLAPGSHTLKVVKRSGQYLLVDVLLSRADTPELSKLNDAQFPDGAFNGAWSHSQNRGQGDHNNDVHFTRTNDDFFSHSFYGDFVKVIMPTASDQGNVEVFLDDVSQGVFDTHSADRQVQQGVFQKSGLGLGPHAIKIVKRSGDYMLFDALEFKHGDSISQLNDSNPLLIYSGSWNNGTRTNGYYKDDIHFTRTNGDSVSYSFVGTDVQFIGPKASDQGEIEFYIDGVSQGRVNTYSAQGSVQQVIFSRTGLDPGTHSIKAVKRSGTFMVFDSMVTSTTTVAKGDQTLTGFRYGASSVTFGSTAPTVTAPSGVQTTLSYSAAPPAVCTVDASSGALTIVGVGSCEITVTAEGTDDYNEATAEYTVTVQTAGTLVLSLNAIATDNTINIAEKAAGFSIGGDTGSVGEVSVTVTVGTADLTATSSTNDPATWSVDVPADAAYITGTSVDVEVNATKTGFTASSAVARSLTVDLTAPEAPTYTAPSSLKVGEAIAAMNPTGGTGIDEHGATGLPSGLSINTATGAIGGTPDTADASTASATITASDSAGNTDTVDIAFPAVAKGDQTLTGFRYGASSVTFGST